MQKKTAQAVRCDVAVLGGGVSGVSRGTLAAARQGNTCCLWSGRIFWAECLCRAWGLLALKTARAIRS